MIGQFAAMALDRRIVLCVVSAPMRSPSGPARR